MPALCVSVLSQVPSSQNATQDTITNGTLRFFIALLIGIAVAAIFGIIIGIPVLRLNGDYLAIVTLGIWGNHQEPCQRSFYRKRFKGISFFNKGCGESEYGTGWSDYH